MRNRAHDILMTMISEIKAEWRGSGELIEKQRQNIEEDAYLEIAVQNVGLYSKILKLEKVLEIFFQEDE